MFCCAFLGSFLIVFCGVLSVCFPVCFAVCFVVCSVVVVVVCFAVGFVVVVCFGRLKVGNRDASIVRWRLTRPGCPTCSQPLW